MKDYKTEAKQRWGNTAAFSEYENKTSICSAEKQQQITQGLNAVFGEFASLKCRGIPADSKEAQALAQKLQAYITENYYTCTNEILLSLGQMYIADERFKNNIDIHAPGTAEYVSTAIKTYCK